jgi:hypothetical protein
MSDAAVDRDDRPHGTALLPRDLTDDELRSAPTLVSAESLVIEDLSDDEVDAFMAALET